MGDPVKFFDKAIAIEQLRQQIPELDTRPLLCEEMKTNNKVLHFFQKNAGIVWSIASNIKAPDTAVYLLQVYSEHLFHDASSKELLEDLEQRDFALHGEFVGCVKNIFKNAKLYVLMRNSNVRGELKRFTKHDVVRQTVIRKAKNGAADV